MHLNRILAVLLLASACTSGHKTHQADGSRVIAAANPGMNYPIKGTSFRMADFKGSTYNTFLKEKLKPALDNFNSKSIGGGDGITNIGSELYKKNSTFLDPYVLEGYKGYSKRHGKKALSDAQVESVYEALRKIYKTTSTDALTYYDRADTKWFTKNHMALALKEAGVNAAPFDLATLYLLTGGFGVKVKIDDYNYNYHVGYLTGKVNPHVQVMSGRSFASTQTRGVGDATDPEYLRDLSKYLKETQDQKPFYRALILSLAGSDPSGWTTVSPLGQIVLSDFLTVYTAEAVRHMMVNLKDGVHPWEIDLAAVTFVSALSSRLGQVVIDGSLTNADLGAWFAPSKNNVAGGPQRSGIGITRRDRVKFQRAIHAYEMSTADGKALIQKIQKIIGTKENTYDVIQGVFEFLSNVNTPRSLGANAPLLADYMAQFIEMARDDAAEIQKSFK